MTNMHRCYVSKSLAERTSTFGYLKCKLVLEDKDLCGIVKGDEVEPTDEGTTETQRRQFQRRERKAFATICLSLGDKQLSLVRSATTAKDAWSKLEGHYEVNPLQINYSCVKIILLCLWGLMSQ